MIHQLDSENSNSTPQGFKPFESLFVAICLLLLIASCEVYNQDDYEEYIVLEAYAVANRPLPDVRVSTTLPTGQKYNFLEAGQSGANVRIFLMNEDGGDEEVFTYRRSPETRGVYVAENRTHRILPRRTYRIEVNFNDRSEVLRAQTTIPDAFEILNEVPDTVVYQSSNRLELLISSFIRTQSQSIFIFNTIIQDEPKPENLTPFYKGILDDDDSIEIEDFYDNDTQPINEGNFDLNPDGTISINYPWIGISFFGNNYVVTNSIDNNLSDLISSQEVQLGGSTLSPGEIPNLHYHVEGGIGIFGSFASDTVETFFKRPEGM